MRQEAMGLKKNLTTRIYRMAKTTARISTSPGSEPRFFRRLLHKKAILRPMDNGPCIVDNLRSIDIAKERIRFDGLAPSPKPEHFSVTKITTEDVRKLMKVAQIEMAKSKLACMGDCISFSEFLGICREVAWDSDQARSIANSIDESGIVIVLGNTVFLHPEKIVKKIRDLIPIPVTMPDGKLKEEFEEMEKRKRAIDKKADILVRRELWAGLGFLMVQTAGFMRLTFWELTWDVMEPICFYVTSMYCMGGYAFFLRTSKEPSFEGFYKSRFLTKQRKLMHHQNFDHERYNELKRIFGRDETLTSSERRRLTKKTTSCGDAGELIN